ncbi:MAG: hypothetical protein KatS3mg131_3718 [Candidatus Tectimicrobiota bacterium]|nr:MAG: hypothetical protein KatS3mg131_3718 [Candidatus Tectomicrobia bacterium]
MTLWQNLQLREKLFVLGAAVAVLLALLFLLVIDPLLARAALLDRQIQAAERQLRELQDLRRQYLHQKQLLDQINARLRQQQNFSLFSKLEELARESGLREKLLYMKPVVSAPSEAYNEEAVEIKMEGVTLAQLVRYLQQVETAPQFLKIKRLHIKPRLDDRQQLSAVFRVSTFTLKEEKR